MGFFSKIGKAFKKVGSVVGKVAKFALPVVGGILAGPLGAKLGGLLGKLSPLAKSFFENTGIGKFISKVAPNLVKKVEDFLDPAKLATLFGKAASPSDFAQILANLTQASPVASQILA